jgi:hypothetical protein
MVAPDITSRDVKVKGRIHVTKVVGGNPILNTESSPLQSVFSPLNRPRFIPRKPRRARPRYNPTRAWRTAS